MLDQRSVSIRVDRPAVFVQVLVLCSVEVLTAFPVVVSHKRRLILAQWLSLPWSVEQRSFQLESEFFDKVDFFIVDIVVIKVGHLLHARLDLRSHSRVLLQVVRPSIRIVRRVDLCHDGVVVCDLVAHFVGDARQELKF